MNVLSDDHPEDIDEIVASLDRTIRTLCARSRNLPVIEATMLAALDALSEKKKAQRRVHELEHELYDDGGETAKMRRELELLRAYIGRHKVTPDKISSAEAENSAADEESAEKIPDAAKTEISGNSSENSADDAVSAKFKADEDEDADSDDEGSSADDEDKDELDELEILLRRRLEERTDN